MRGYIIEAMDRRSVIEARDFTSPEFTYDDDGELVEVRVDGEVLPYPWGT